MDKCPDCKGELETGTILDSTYGSVLMQKYARADAPEKLSALAMYETNFNDLRRVITYRCKNCNRLFSYAQDKVLIKDLKSVRNNTIGWILLIMFVFMVVIFIWGQIVG